MGKRQVGELEVSELVITFLLSELAVLPISNKNAPLSHAIIPGLLLLAAEVIFSFVLSKSERFRKFAIGRPSIIINKGELDRKELSKLRIGISELMSELRLKGAASLSEVEYAIVEENGQLSVFKRAASSGLTPSDVGIEAKEHGIAHCVIASGKVSDEGLRAAGRDRAWLAQKLAPTGASEDAVFLMTVDDAGDTIIIMKNRNSDEK
ncbi:MAG: DUF421 domain-containing protein [Clostridia bacterium]|nr:DUF421 domain-containing protein [Clostridia bacterium]